MKKNFLALLVVAVHAYDHDTLLEFKAAYFLSVSDTFKNIYGNGSALFGPECTFRLYKGLYGFASIDFFTKNQLTLTGSSVSAGQQTLAHNGYEEKIFFMPIGLGLKYFVPFTNHSLRVSGDFYLGLGIEPAYLRTQSTVPGACSTYKNGGVGGITKIGAYFNLPHKFLLDLFFDYSFMWIKNGSNTLNVNGCIFGAGLGYRFN